MSTTGKGSVWRKRVTAAPKLRANSRTEMKRAWWKPCCCIFFIFVRVSIRGNQSYIVSVQDFLWWQMRVKLICIYQYYTYAKRFAATIVLSALERVAIKNPPDELFFLTWMTIFIVRNMWCGNWDPESSHAGWPPAYERETNASLCKAELFCPQLTRGWKKSQYCLPSAPHARKVLSISSLKNDRVCVRQLNSQLATKNDCVKFEIDLPPIRRRWRSVFF